MNQEVTNYGSRLAERMQGKYPDRQFTDAEGNIDNNRLLEAISEDLNSLDGKVGEYEANNRQMVDLFKTNPKAAAFLNTWVQTKSPALAFRKIYGQNAFEAITSEEGASIIAEIEAEESKRKADDEAFLAEKESNLNASFDALDSWGDSKGLSDEQKVAVFKTLNDLLIDAEMGKYSEDFFEMAWKAEHYAGDIESARHEGEVAGRNARIDELTKRRQASESLPPAMSGQGSNVTSRPKKPSWGDYLK